MADQQRIHPVPHDDVEAPPPQQASPTAPLVPHGANKSSEMGNPPETSAYPPPLRRTYPPAAMHSKPPKRRRGCLCRCFCWTLSLILILLITLAIIAGILFLVFRPKLPKYSVDTLRITRFNVSGDSSLQASFDVTITARNPNKRIGIYYEGGSRINVWFRETKLCEGSLPKFYQGHRNTTVLVVPLTGQTENAAGLVREVNEQRQATGNVPLRLRVKQPVRVKLGKLKLMKVNFRVRCLLLVDDLSANAVNIRSSSCKFRFRL